MFRKKEERKEGKEESIKDDILFLYKAVDDMTWSVDVLRKPDRESTFYED